MVGVWEGLNLGSIPNDHMPSQKDPQIPIDRRCSTILPRQKRIHEPKAMNKAIIVFTRVSYVLP